MTLRTMTLHHNDNKHKGTQHNDTTYYQLVCDTQHNITLQSYSAFILSVIIPNAIMQRVVMLSRIKLCRVLFAWVSLYWMTWLHAILWVSWKHLPGTNTLARKYERGKYHCTIDLLFDWFGISCMINDNFCFYLQNRLIKNSQTGGQWYSDTSTFNIIPCFSFRSTSRYLQYWNFTISISFLIKVVKKNIFNGIVHIRHQCRKTTALSCWICLINTGVEKMNNI
jgi:hypothetical protein